MIPIQAWGVQFSFFFLLGVGVRSLRADLSLFNPAFLELRIPLSLPLPPQFWDYRREPPQVCTSPGAFLFLKLLQSVNLFKTKDIDEQRKTAKVWGVETAAGLELLVIDDVFVFSKIIPQNSGFYYGTLLDYSTCGNIKSKGRKGLLTWEYQGCF